MSGVHENVGHKSKQIKNTHKTNKQTNKQTTTTTTNKQNTSHIHKLHS